MFTSRAVAELEGGDWLVVGVFDIDGLQGVVLDLYNSPALSQVRQVRDVSTY